MKCTKCSSKAELAFTNGNLCSKCFLDVIIARVKKAVKGEFKRGEVVVAAGNLVNYFLKKTLKIPVKLILSDKTPDKITAKYDKLAVSWTADDEAHHFYLELMKKKPKFSKNKKIVRIFKNISDNELDKISKILNIKHKLNKKTKEFQKIIKKYPHSAFSLKKSAEEFKKIIK